MKHGKLVFGLLILVLASCYLPQNPGNVDGTETDVQLTVKTDKSRDQGVYVNEDGDSFDIVSEEGPDGEIVRCVEAVDIVRIDDGAGEAAKCLGGSGIVKALILGRRTDGYPGVWEVQNDDSILPVSYNKAGEKNSKAGDSCEVEWLMHGFFGWRYHVLKPILGPDSEGGYIFVGYAENTRGIDFGGHWTVEEGTTVAVYWRLEKKNRHFHLSRARIIGEPNEDYDKWNKDSDKDLPYQYRYRHSMFVRFFFSLYNSFKFFFLESFDTYLTDVIEDAYEYDKQQDLFLVTGHVDGSFSQPATVEKGYKGGSVEEVEEKGETRIGTAAITPTGEITITVKGGSNGGGGSGIVYQRIVIDIYPPSGLGEPDTEIALYDKDGSTELAKDESGFPGLAGSIDTKTDVEELLSSGTYFIKVYHENPSGGGQPYVVRAISLGLDDTIPPGTPYADGVPAPIPAYDPNADSSYEGANDTPSSTTAVLELDVDWVQRYLSSGTDVDWLKLVLP